MEDSLFTPAHHALLFAWIAKSVIEQAGLEKGQLAIRKGIQRYGEQRGHRMALRALADKQPLSMTTFLSYGEWNAEPETMLRTVFADGEGLLMKVSLCPWNSAWLDNNFSAYGRLYCLEIDTALLRGFNPELKISVKETLSNGDKHCIFEYQDAGLHDTLPAKGRIMPWHYHIGHLYKTMGEVLQDELGSVGKSAMDYALILYRERFGIIAVGIIISYMGTDFNVLPNG